MKIYCMSDIHGCLNEFDYALSLIENRLCELDIKLILLGDYIHGPDSYGVLDRIMALQDKWGSDRVIALCGNHEDMAVEGHLPINQWRFSDECDSDKNDEPYLRWMMRLPRYHVEGNTIFVHAGIEEEAEDLWQRGTDDFTFTEKYPAKTGFFFGDWKIVAGHVGTSEIADNPHFHDIFFDGQSHYYIDGSVLSSGTILILKVDTEQDKYYRVTESGEQLILPYGKEN